MGAPAPPHPPPFPPCLQLGAEKKAGRPCTRQPPAEACVCTRLTPPLSCAALGGPVRKRYPITQCGLACSPGTAALWETLDSMFSGSLRVLALQLSRPNSHPPPSAFYSKLASVPLGQEKGATFPRTVFLPGKPPGLRVSILKSRKTRDCFTAPVGVCSPGANPRSVTWGTSGALAELPLGGSWGERTATHTCQPLQP